MALASIFQCASQVEKLAKFGHAAPAQFETAINSLLCQNPDQPLDVYGQISNLELGLSTLIDVFERRPVEHKDAIRYVMSVLHLQKQLMKRQDMLAVIGSRLEKSQQQVESFSSTHENVVANLAEVYTDTISRLSFRIQVMGEYNYLQQSRIANQVRVLLFAAIRSAVLWRQLGGNRLTLIWKRKQAVQLAKKSLEEAKRELLH